MKGLSWLDWYSIKVNAFTAIRVRFSVEVLERLALEDNPTPVSGDVLAADKRSHR